MKTIKKLTENFASNYIHYHYGYLKHDIKKLVQASRMTAKQYKCSPLDMFFFMIENRKINNMHLSEYGFNTILGREVRETFKNNYYE